GSGVAAPAWLLQCGCSGEELARSPIGRPNFFLLLCDSFLHQRRNFFLYQRLRRGCSGKELAQERSPVGRPNFVLVAPACVAAPAFSQAVLRKIKDLVLSLTPSPIDDKDEGVPGDDIERGKMQSIVTIGLTIVTSSQAIPIVWSKRAGKYEYSVTSANFLYYIFAYVDAPGYQILKNLNIISTGILYGIILKKGFQDKFI
ncbi:hypothetical protein V2J09_016308, partial [Rumex salicifolius]